MKLVTVSSKTILQGFGDEPRECFVANSRKQLFRLQVRYIDPEELRVEVGLPAELEHQIDSGTNWDLSFRDQKGAYQAPVRRMLRRDDYLIFFLETYLFFLARREKIRLPIEARNIIHLRFSCHGKECRGLVVDFNLEGIGIQVDKNLEIEVDDELINGSFTLADQHLSFNRARVAHLAYVEDGIRVGLQFMELNEEQADAVRQAFDAWFVSHKPSVSSPDEG